MAQQCNKQERLPPGPSREPVSTWMHSVCLVSSVASLAVGLGPEMERRSGWRDCPCGVNHVGVPAFPLMPVSNNRACVSFR